MQDKIAIARTLTGLIAGRSVGNVVTKAVKHSVPTNNNIEKIELIIGSTVIAGMVADKAITWTTGRFDETVETIRELRARMQEASAEKEDSTEE